MSRATIVYIVMLLACVAGVWAILRAGSRLEAPTQLSGAWSIVAEDPALIEQLGSTLTLEQSGRFVQITFQRGLSVDVKLVDGARPDPDAGRLLDMRFEGPTWKLSALGPGAGGPLIFRLTGPENHQFTVTRLVEGKGDDDVIQPQPTASLTDTAGAAVDADAGPADAP
jgi:hypothetical protein